VQGRNSAPPGAAVTLARGVAALIALWYRTATTLTHFDQRGPLSAPGEVWDALRQISR
jgi:hypothetical protein